MVWNPIGAERSGRIGDPLAGLRKIGSRRGSDAVLAGENGGFLSQRIDEESSVRPRDGSQRLWLEIPDGNNASSMWMPPPDS